MNYKAVYCKLIGRAACRMCEVDYSENHHIVPKSLGGPDVVSNMVKLSGREHLLAHALLYHMYKRDIDPERTKKMAKAWMAVSRMKHSHMDRFDSDWHKSASVRAVSKHGAEKGVRRCGAHNSQYKTEKLTFFHVQTREEFVGTRGDWVKHTNRTSTDVSTLVRGHRTSCWGWVIVVDGFYPLDLPKSRKTVYKFKHIDGKRMMCSRDELRQADPSTTSSGLGSMVNGHIKSHRGWSLE